MKFLVLSYPIWSATYQQYDVNGEKKIKRGSLIHVQMGHPNYVDTRHLVVFFCIRLVTAAKRISSGVIAMSHMRLSLVLHLGVDWPPLGGAPWSKLIMVSYLRSLSAL